MSRRRIAVAGAILAGWLSAGLMAAPAAQAAGSPGFCPTDEGVTVVIDFQALGGTTIVRCAPGPVGPGFTGLDALYGAGIQVEGPRRWGEAFICRIEGRPGPGEALPVDGKPGYKELCIDTPPAAAYWSYWHAPNGGSWQYSQWGVKNRKAIKGGFEGWSFSLNATASSNPAPRIAPVRPGPAPELPVQPEEPEPSTDDPGEQAPGGGGPGQQGPDGQSNPGGQGNPGDAGGHGNSGGPGGHGNSGGPGGTGNGSQGGGPAGTGSDETSTGPGDQRAPGALPPPLPRESSPAREAPAGTPPAQSSSEPSGQPSWTGGEESEARAAEGSELAGVPATTLVAVAATAALVLGGTVIARRRRRVADQ